MRIDAVSRQDVINICRRYNGKGYVWAAIACRVRQLPAIRPDTAEWIRVGKTGRNYECSACGAFLNMGRFNAGRGSAKYCPNCGARMEETNG